MMPDSITNDVLIVGGGHAGLSAALTLYRALHTSVIFDTHRPRNWYSSPVRLMPIWEHQDPESFRETSRAELRESGLSRFVDAGIERVGKLDNGLFQIVDINGGLRLGRNSCLRLAWTTFSPLWMAMRRITPQACLYLIFYVYNPESFRLYS